MYFNLGEMFIYLFIYLMQSKKQYKNVHAVFETIEQWIYEECKFLHGDLKNPQDLRRHENRQMGDYCLWTHGDKLSPLWEFRMGEDALDSWKIHEKWQRLTSYRIFQWQTGKSLSNRRSDVFKMWLEKKSRPNVSVFPWCIARVTLPAIFSPGC